MAAPKIRLLVVALATVAAACASSEPDAQLRDDLRAQADANDAVRERVVELSVEVAQLREVIEESDATDRLDATEAAIADLDERLDDLATRGATHSDEIAELRIALRDLRDSLSALDGAVTSLRNELRELETRHNLLEQRFDNHQHHPPG